MKHFLLLLTTCFSISSFASQKQSVTLGGERQSESIWVELRPIKNKNVYLLGYKSRHDRVLERVIPKSEYAKIQNEMTKWSQKWGTRMPALALFNCNDPVVFNFNQSPRLICVDKVNRQQKTAFTRWFNQNVRMNLGMN